MKEGRRYASIALAVVLMATVVFVGGELVRQARLETVAPVRVPASEPDRVLARQTGQYRALGTRWEPDRAAAVASDRELGERRARRAHPLAPPAIPHPLEARLATGAVCLSCHRFGGWTPKLQAHAPVTPHPEWTSCQQCHVPTHDVGLFRETSFLTVPALEIDAEALPGGPPPIPHALRMRENCVACHAGPSAPASIRTTHPERAGCLQCHVVVRTTETWRRPDRSAPAGAAERPAPDGDDS